MTASVAERLRGALLGAALGDAVGAPFEGRWRVAQAPVETWLDAAEQMRWTDDTHMALTLGEVLRDSGGTLDSQQLGDAFAAAYAAEPWRGYGAGPPQVFALAARGVPYVEAAGSLFGGSGSFGNGAAMRVTPVALVARLDLDHAAQLAKTQARVTHTHPEAVDAAVLIGTAVCALAQVGDEVPSRRSTVAATTDRLPPGALRSAVREILAADQAGEDVVAVAKRIGTGVAARESVPAAVAALLVGWDVRSTLITAVCLGGDTDTIAAMAGAMAGAVYGASDIPERLLGRLEASGRLDAVATALLSQSL